MASLMKIGLVTVIKRKVKFTVEIPRRPREGELSYSSTFSFASALDGGWSNPRPGRFTPGKEPVSI